MPKRVLPLVCVAALLHSWAYIVHQQPDRDVAWSDQGGYKQLGAALATSGTYSREPDAATYVPEAIRTPGYPVFVAVVYRLTGVGNVQALVWAQAFVFVGICLAAYAIARRIVQPRGALLAAALTAAYPPIPYFGGLVMTEIWATLLLTIALLACFRARETDRLGWGVATGAFAAAVGLTRPAFWLFPFVMVGVMALVDGGSRWRVYAVAVATAAVLFAPWFAYNYIHFGQLTISPANGLGRAFWEASWQGVWPGRVQNELTLTADRLWDRAELDAEVRRIAAAERLDPTAMLEYVHQWQDIRSRWVNVTDRREWMEARIAADSVYMRVGIANALRDPVAHLKRRVVRALPVLWAGEIPYRYTEINRLPTWTIRLIWAAQAILVGLAFVGTWFGLRSSLWRETLLVALPFLYITAVHSVLLTEARQSLPGMPAVLVLASAGIIGLVRLRHEPAALRTRQRT